jgi:hypothetical protein
MFPTSQGEERRAARTMETILFLYAVVAVLLAFGGVTVILVRRDADRRYIVALALFAALSLFAFWALIS